MVNSRKKGEKENGTFHTDGQSVDPDVNHNRNNRQTLDVREQDQHHDHHRNQFQRKKKQKKWKEQQMDGAAEVVLAVVVHQRHVGGEVVQVDVDGDPVVDPLCVVLHMRKMMKEKSLVNRMNKTLLEWQKT